jgi:hypothetical protein
MWSDKGSEYTQVLLHLQVVTQPVLFMGALYHLPMPLAPAQGWSALTAYHTVVEMDKQS